MLGDGNTLVSQIAPAITTVHSNVHAPQILKIESQSNIRHIMVILFIKLTQFYNLYFISHSLRTSPSRSKLNNLALSSCNQDLSV